MNTGLSLNCVLIAIMILGIILVLGGSKETFMSAPYPQSVEKGILYGDYPMAANPGLSSATYKDAMETISCMGRGLLCTANK